MAARSISALKAEAKAAGVPAALIRENIDSASRLEALIADHQRPRKAKGGNMPVRKATPKKATPRRAAKTEAPKRRGRPPGSKNKPKVEAEAPKRRGRPPGSKNKKVTAPVKRGPGRPKKAITTTATRKTTVTRKRTPAVKASKNGDAGRLLLDGVDFKVTDGWNPRAGSPPDLIIKAVRKAQKSNGSVDREKVFESLKSQARNFLRNKPPNNAKGNRQAENMLRYRISRIMWQFAIQTDQHVKAENRAEYGTAGTGTGTWKPKKATKPAQTTPKRRGRPPKAQTAPRRGRPPKAASTAPVKRGRGRPKGSKNKVKAGR